jgi:hypothetical protein
MNHNIKGFKRISLGNFAFQAVEEHETMHLTLEQFKATSLRLKVNIPSGVFALPKVKRGLWNFKDAYVIGAGEPAPVEAEAPAKPKAKAKARPHRKAKAKGEAAEAIALVADLPDEGVEVPEHLLNGPSFEAELANI